MELKRLCGKVWILERKFQIQERPNNIFIISFDLIKDRNKVLRGGPWWYQQVPIMIQLYDGVKSILAMDSLFFWVCFKNIPPKYEIPENFPSIASVPGRYIEYDDKLFMQSKKVRVRVEKKLSDPILTSKNIKLATNAEEQIDFYFENCLSICDACNLVFHENGKCRANSSYIAG
ncbi:hypothetical protein ACLB2K_072376 [Fragaria x ananassa]